MEVRGGVPSVGCGHSSSPHALCMETSRPRAPNDTDIRTGKHYSCPRDNQVPAQ